MSGGSKQQTTTQTAQPYKAARPGLDFAFGQATDLGKAGTLAQPNTMSTVVPFSQQTTQGMGDLQNVGLANRDGAGLQWNAQDIINHGGLNADQMIAKNLISETANNPFDINANPAFQDVLRQSTDAATNAVNQNAQAMGRYSGGAHQGILAQEVGDLTSRMVGDEYRNWQGRRDNAQDRLFNAGQTAQGNLGNAYELAQAPAQTQMGVGGMYEDLYGRQLNDNLRIADETMNQPANNLKELMALLGGAGQFGTTRQSAQVPNSTFSNIAGGLLGGASLLRGL